MTPAPVVRTCGAIVVATGLLAAWQGLWVPLRSTGPRETTYDLALYTMVPTFVVLGAFLLVGGGRIPYRTDDHRNLTRAGWWLIAAIALGAADLMTWLQPQFAARGMLGM
jgi:hypothetical protein